VEEVDASLLRQDGLRKVIQRAVEERVEGVMCYSESKLQRLAHPLYVVELHYQLGFVGKSASTQEGEMLPRLVVRIMDTGPVKQRLLP
jgi:hypothetical protein